MSLQNDPQKHPLKNGGLGTIKILGLGPHKNHHKKDPQNHIDQKVGLGTFKMMREITGKIDHKNIVHKNISLYEV